MTAERYFGTWTVTMRGPNGEVFDFQYLAGWDEKQAMRAAEMYTAGYDCKAIGARKTSAYRHQLELAL